MQADLNGRVAIVTGAGRLEGLGFAIAKLLGEAGAAVVISDFDRESVAPALDALERAERAVVAVAGDVTDPSTMQQAIGAAVETFGRLDVLVNNAGVWTQAAFGEWTAESWNNVFAVNTTAPLLWSQAAVAQMRSQGDGGSIINIVSVSSEIVIMEETLAYEASKAATQHMTHGMGRALAEEGIRVNNVLPGPMATGHVGGRGTAPMARRAHPDEIARGVVFLASDLASFVTGADWRIDGGRVHGPTARQAMTLLAEADANRRTFARGSR